MSRTKTDKKQLNIFVRPATIEGLDVLSNLTNEARGVVVDRLVSAALDALVEQRKVDDEEQE